MDEVHLEEESVHWEYAQVTLLRYQEGQCTRVGRESGDPEWDDDEEEYAVNRCGKLNGVPVKQLMCLEVENECETEGARDELGSYRCWRTQYGEECALVRCTGTALNATADFDHHVWREGRFRKDLETTPLHELIWHAADDDEPDVGDPSSSPAKKLRTEVSE